MIIILNVSSQDTSVDEVANSGADIIGGLDYIKQVLIDSPLSSYPDFINVLTKHKN